MQLGMTLVRKRAVEKTSQALREGQPKFRQQMVELGGVAVVAAAGGGTSTATASGVAALQLGTGDNNNNCCNGSFVPDVFLFVFWCATISPAPTRLDSVFVSPKTTSRMLVSNTPMVLASNFVAD